MSDTTAPATIRQAIEKEIALIQAMAPTVLGPGQSLRVHSFKDTRLIGITVVSTDAKAAADACNAIAQKYTAATNGGLQRELIDSAAAK